VVRLYRHVSILVILCGTGTYSHNTNTNRFFSVTYKLSRGANKCQNARWNRWVFKRFLNLLVSVISWMLSECDVWCSQQCWRTSDRVDDWIQQLTAQSGPSTVVHVQCDQCSIASRYNTAEIKCIRTDTITERHFRKRHDL